MKAAGLFLAGLLVGSAVTIGWAQTGRSVTRLPGVVGLNHVAISVTDLDASLRYYRDTLGFQEAFTVRDDQGQPSLTYLQISRNTFLELVPARADRPAGFYHFGVQVENMDAAVAGVQQRGATVTNLRTGQTRSRVGNLAGPDGVSIELAENGPESLQRRAIDAWQ